MIFKEVNKMFVEAVCAILYLQYLLNEVSYLDLHNELGCVLNPSIDCYSFSTGLEEQLCIVH